MGAKATRIKNCLGGLVEDVQSKKGRRYKI